LIYKLAPLDKFCVRNLSSHFFTYKSWD